MRHQTNHFTKPFENIMQFNRNLCALICTIFLTASTLQAQMYSKGQQDLHLGIGLLSTFYGGGFHSILPPINVSYEKGITDNIGVGGYLGYASARYNYYGFTNVDYYWRYNYFILGARGAYHYDLFKVPNLDTYGGLMLGFTIASSTFHSSDPTYNSSSYSSPASGGITWSGFIGARYQIKPKLGVYGEIGYGVSVLNLGLRFKL